MTGGSTPAATMRFGLGAPHVAAHPSLPAIVDRCRDIVSPGGAALVPFLRTDATYLPRQVGAGTGGSDIPAFVTARHRYAVQGEDDWSDYDNLVSLLERAGLKWIASVHPIRMLAISSAQDVADFAEVCARVHQRYGSALAGVELWNEPNTGSGDMGGTMTPALAADLNRQGGQALRSAGCPVVMGGVIGGFDLSYVKQMTTALPDWARYLTHVTAHCYPGKWAPDTQPGSLPPAASARILPSSLVPFRQYLEGHFPGVRFGVTEAGYAGTSVSNGAPNVHSLAEADEWETEMVRNFRSQGVDFYTHFQVLDDGLVAYSDDSAVNPRAPWHPGFYVEKLGLSSSAGVMKPFARSYARLAAGLL